MRFLKKLIYFFSIANTSLWPSPFDGAKKEIAEAISFYKKGNWESSRIYLDAARRKFPEKLDHFPKALRLKILLLLADKNYFKASVEIKKYLKLREDPYFYYFLGQYYFQDRKFNLSKKYFKKSTEISLKKYAEDFHSEKTPVKTGVFIKEHSLFLCNFQAEKKQFNIKKNPEESFRNKNNAKMLWSKQMSIQEIRLAAYHARVLDSYFLKQKLSKKYSKKKSNIPSDSAILALIRAPENKTRPKLGKTTRRLIASKSNLKDYKSCIKALKFQYLHKFTGRPLTKNDKNKIKGYIYNVHLHRVFAFNTNESRFQLANHLLSQSQQSQNLQALHVIRSIRGRAKLFLLKTGADYYLLLKVFHHQLAIYKALGWEADRMSIQRMIKALRKFKNSVDQKKKSEAIDLVLQQNMILELLDRASENKNSIESLELLILHTEPEESAILNALQNRLKKIRKDRERTEFPSAFYFYYQ